MPSYSYLKFHHLKKSPKRRNPIMGVIMSTFWQQIIIVNKRIMHHQNNKTKSHDHALFSWSRLSRPPSNVTVTFQKKFYVRDLFVWSMRTHPYAQIVPSIPGSASTKNRGLLFSSPGCCFFFRQQNELKRLHISITVTFPLQILW